MHDRTPLFRIASWTAVGCRLNQMLRGLGEITASAIEKADRLYQ
jgi:hypothetical protein